MQLCAHPCMRARVRVCASVWACARVRVCVCACVRRQVGKARVCGREARVKGNQQLGAAINTMEFDPACDMFPPAIGGWGSEVCPEGSGCGRRFVANQAVCAIDAIKITSLQKGYCTQASSFKKLVPEKPKWQAPLQGRQTV
eukprot:2347230-Amphidinium_carterae.1